MCYVNCRVNQSRVTQDPQRTRCLSFCHHQSKYHPHMDNILALYISNHNLITVYGTK